MSKNKKVDLKDRYIVQLELEKLFTKKENTVNPANAAKAMADTFEVVVVGDAVEIQPKGELPIPSHNFPGTNADFEESIDILLRTTFSPWLMPEVEVHGEEAPKGENKASKGSEAAKKAELDAMYSEAKESGDITAQIAIKGKYADHGIPAPL